MSVRRRVCRVSVYSLDVLEVSWPDSVVFVSVGSTSAPRRLGVVVPRFEREEAFWPFADVAEAPFFVLTGVKGVLDEDEPVEAREDDDGMLVLSKKSCQERSFCVATIKTCFSYRGST